MDEGVSGVPFSGVKVETPVKGLLGISTTTRSLLVKGLG
jgi:hypothetical protein